MSKQSYDRQLAELDDLRNRPADAAAMKALGSALANRNNYLAAKAAAIAGRLGAKELIPALLAAMDRFYLNAAKSDPQCWAKIAIAKALSELGHHDAATFLRGLRHIQLEAVWGGRSDTAGPLRARCAMALLECSELADHELLSHLIDALFDADKTVRSEAARAIGQVGRPEAALVLRTRALAGDAEPEVSGACFTALLAIEGYAGAEFVGRFLDRDGDAAGEAALALGEMRDPRVLPILINRFRRPSGEPLGSMLLTAIALTRLPEALDFLLALIRQDEPAAEPAMRALAAIGAAGQIAGQARAAAEASGNPRLRAAFESEFASRAESEKDYSV